MIHISNLYTQCITLYVVQCIIYTVYVEYRVCTTEYPLEDTAKLFFLN